MNYSKLAYGLFLAGFISTIYAQPSPLNGFYAEVAGGGSILNSNFNSQALIGPFSSPSFTPFETNNYALSESIKTSDTSAIGELSIGFGHQLDRYPVYFGADLFANDAHRQADTSNLKTNSLVVFGADVLNLNILSQSLVKLKNIEYGADIKAGLLITPTTLVYGLIGEAINRLDYNFNNSFLINYPSSGVNTPIASFNNVLFKRNLRGLRLGGGIEKYLSSNFALDMRYIYTNYGHIETNNTTGLTSLIGDFNLPFVTLFVPDGFIEKSKTDISSQELLFGLKYYFNPLYSNHSQVDEPLFNFNGFYAGIEGGGTEAVAKVNRSISVNNLFLFRNVDLPESISNHQSANSWNSSGMGEIYIGYGLLTIPKPLYLSTELFANYSRNRITAESFANKDYINIFITPPPNVRPLYIVSLLNKTNVKLNDLEYGIDIKPGFYLSPSSLLYGRIGAAITDLELDSNSLLELSFPFSGINVPQLPLNKESDKNTVGLRLGLGIEQYLNHNFTINLDYIYTDYENFKINNTGNIINLVDTVSGPTFIVTPNAFSNRTKISLTSHQFMGGIKYYFEM